MQLLCVDRGVHDDYFVQSENDLYHSQIPRHAEGKSFLHQQHLYLRKSKSLTNTPRYLICCKEISQKKARVIGVTLTETLEIQL